MAKLKDLYYVTAASGYDFITNFSQYSVKSLLKSGITKDKIHVCVNNKEDEILFKSLVNIDNIYIVNEKIDHIKWTYTGGKRKYSVFKSASLYKIFPNPILENEGMIYFDGDVLFFKNPTPFLMQFSDKTWFHHGKDLETVSIRRLSNNGNVVKKKNIDIKDYKSLCKWVSEPCAWLMIKNNAEILPDREAVAGFYLLHPRDHSKLLKKTYEFCCDLISGFKKNHEDCGDQKPMNAALSILKIDWHGGSRFDCLEHEEYFIHYFGGKSSKKQFKEDRIKLGL